MSEKTEEDIKKFKKKRRYKEILIGVFCIIGAMALMFSTPPMQMHQSGESDTLTSIIFNDVAPWVIIVLGLYRLIGHERVWTYISSFPKKNKW